MTRYDEAQTRGIEAVRTRLQSIAIQAVKAQDMDACGDPIHDLLDDLARDLKFAQVIAQHLNADRVYLAEAIALTGNLNPELKDR